jgi:hypothetical protein
MGMFDWVRYEEDCPNCGKHLDGFQSKSSYSMLEQIKPHKVDNFYTPCYNCKVWINYTKGRNKKKWTRKVYEDYFGDDEKLLDEHTKKFSKKELKALATRKR